MKTIEIDTASLNSDINTLRSQLESVRSLQARLINTMNTVDGMWDGPANQAFVAQYQSDDERMRQLCDMISRSIDRVEFARTNYDSCDNEVTGIINSINI